MVRDALSREAGRSCEIVPITTTGDRVQDRSLADIGGKGLFTKEIELALLRDEIDLAVHSMKDVPVLLPPGLCIGAVLLREDASDAFVSHLARSLDELPKGSRIGTSAVRRAAQIRRARPDLRIVEMRGNVDTRLGRLDSGTVDALVLASAGLKRLGLEERMTSRLSGNTWLPALAQGAVGIELRANDAGLRDAVARINHRETEIALACERAFQAALDGSCRTPIAGFAECRGRHLFFRGEVLAPDGSDFHATHFEHQLGANAADEAAEAGRSAGLELRARAGAWLAF